ncbi:hypothetical protein BD779DRAFT_1550362 [Infundibulicybe gibba]|nr:hypothetical protein BD779DRAFT_1550362 [Infundibulicybe gibba]
MVQLIYAHKLCLNWRARARGPIKKGGNDSWVRMEANVDGGGGGTFHGALKSTGPFGLEMNRVAS